MSIYRLYGDIWDVILPYLDTPDTIRLLLCGDLTLCAILKPVIRDFVVELKHKRIPSLSLLLHLFKFASIKQQRFSLSLGTHYDDFQSIYEAYTVETWKRVFPQTSRRWSCICPVRSPPFPRYSPILRPWHLDSRRYARAASSTTSPGPKHQ